jgi:hypothetical protein
MKKISTYFLLFILLPILLNETACSKKDDPGTAPGTGTFTYSGKTYQGTAQCGNAGPGNSTIDMLTSANGDLVYLYNIKEGTNQLIDAEAAVLSGSFNSNTVWAAINTSSTGTILLAVSGTVTKSGKNFTFNAVFDDMGVEKTATGKFTCK